MFRKLNLKILVVLLAVLVGVVFISYYVKNKKGERTIRKEFYTLDTAQVSKISIWPKTTGFQEVAVVRENGNWMIQSNGKNFTSDLTVVNSMLSALVNLKPQRLAATSEDKWEHYEVNDSLGSRLKVFCGNQLITDLVVGKFSYQQAPGDNYQRQGKMTSYIRLTDEPEVYAVEGFLNMIFNRTANDLRNKTLINSQAENWTKLTFNYPADSSFILSNQNGSWLFNGLPVDSNNVKKYFNSIAVLNTRGILDEDLPVVANPEYSLRIEGNNISAITIDAYPADTINKYYITSSLNEGANFSGSEGGLFDKIFISPSKLLVQKEITE